MACGGVNWNDLGITRPREQAVTVNSFWMSEVLPTITWLKQACPTCYTFPYDDMSSTFTCEKKGGSGNNITNYTITISDLTQPL